MQDPSTAAASGGRLAEVCAALCLGSDLYTGFGYEHGIRATVIAAGIADALGMSADERVDVYYASLLAMLGCSSTPEIGEILGDYVSFGSAMAAAGVDPTSKREMGPFTIRHAGAGEPLARRLSLLARMMSSAAALAAGQLGHCEVATRFAQRLGLGGGIQHDLGFVYERWDGQGARGDSGESIPPAMRVVHVAKQAALHLTLGGVEAAVSIVGTRSGRAFEPGVAGTFIDRADVICEPVATGVGAWEAVLDAEPGTPRVLDPGELDAACEVAADMADQTSRWFHGHSRAVAELAGAAAAARGFDISEVVDVRRAGWLHDLGVLAVANPAWDRPGPLDEAALQDVRLHAYHAERILSRATCLDRAGRWAGLHHEGLDAGGYHRGAGAKALPAPARVLAVADVYQALVSERPHRPAFEADAAADELEAMAARGLLDVDAVAAVLDAAGHARAQVAGTRPAGLTEREVDVLRLAARGRSIKQVAGELGIRPKTVDTHLQHAYAKIGCSTRSAATLFAIENGLV